MVPTYYGLKLNRIYVVLLSKMKNHSRIVCEIEKSIETLTFKIFVIFLILQRYTEHLVEDMAPCRGDEA